MAFRDLIRKAFERRDIPGTEGMYTGPSIAQNLLRAGETIATAVDPGSRAGIGPGYQDVMQRHRAEDFRDIQRQQSRQKQEWLQREWEREAEQTEWNRNIQKYGLMRDIIAEKRAGLLEDYKGLDRDAPDFTEKRAEYESKFADLRKAEQSAGAEFGLPIPEVGARDIMTRADEAIVEQRAAARAKQSYWTERTRGMSNAEKIQVMALQREADPQGKRFKSPKYTTDKLGQRFIVNYVYDPFSAEADAEGFVEMAPVSMAKQQVMKPTEGIVETQPAIPEGMATSRTVVEPITTGEPGTVGGWKPKDLDTMQTKLENDAKDDLKDYYSVSAEELPGLKKQLGPKAYELASTSYQIKRLARKGFIPDVAKRQMLDNLIRDIKAQKQVRLENPDGTIITYNMAEWWDKREDALVAQYPNADEYDLASVIVDELLYEMSAYSGKSVDLYRKSLAQEAETPRQRGKRIKEGRQTS